MFSVCSPRKAVEGYPWTRSRVPLPSPSPVADTIGVPLPSLPYPGCRPDCGTLSLPSPPSPLAADLTVVPSLSPPLPPPGCRPDCDTLPPTLPPGYRITDYTGDGTPPSVTQEDLSFLPWFLRSNFMGMF